VVPPQNDSVTDTIVAEFFIVLKSLIIEALLNRL